ncbi:type I DNA topoisomerase [Anaerolineales bacterium HSG25]|nr:type I DNA topoisomerase [Anaerolineales bacterium HSG25]
MTKTLIIVESAKKAKTIKGILGKGYTVKASSGHILEMPKDDLHVNLNTFQPTLYLIRGKGKLLDNLKRAANNADTVYLATDLDREGEAIAHHIITRLGSNVARRAKRIAFTAITERDIRKALANPREVDQNLVQAQVARRTIDRLVGYMVSPVLWAGLSGVKRLSAGRVQSPALWLIVTRERTIRNFKPEEWWSVDAELSKQAGEDNTRFWARLVKIDGKKPSLKNGKSAHDLKTVLENASWPVSAVKKGERLRYPYPPFTTDTLQQAASSQLGMSPKRTMQLAQQLYEGIKVGEGKQVGLITYLRTDSVAVAPEAQETARQIVIKYWGTDYLPPKPPHYTTRDKTAQEAHEAIRPTDAWRTPKKIESYLDAQQYQLYRLIWRRFVASQMKPARYDTISIDITPLLNQTATPYLFRATGSTLRFAGFLKVYGVDEYAEVARTNKKKTVQDELPTNRSIPNLTAGDWLNLHQLLPKQHFTKPPARYTEAGLIGELKKRGLGRPSTYASIIDTLKNRRYVVVEKKRLHPTSLGFQVCELLEKHVQSVVDVDFTARMEADLDAIANGQASRLQIMRNFYHPFKNVVDTALVEAKRHRQPAVRQSRSKKGANSKQGNKRGRTGKGKKSLPKSPDEGQPCPTCEQGQLLVRSGKYGPFIGCTRYKEGCRYTKKLNDNK